MVTHKHTLEEIDRAFQHHSQQLGDTPQLATLVKSLLYSPPDAWKTIAQTKASMDWELVVLEPLYDLPATGELLLLQFQNAGFQLLVYTTGAWNTLMPDGSLEAFKLSMSPAIQQAVWLKPGLTPSAANTMFESITSLLKKNWIEIGLSSFLINGGLLLLPLFSMLIYDKVVNNGIFETLWALTIGMLIYIASDLVMRLSRNWSTENMARHLSLHADTQLWQRILMDHTHNMPFAKVLTYYRDVSASRDFVSSHYLLALLDLPFLMLYLVAVGIIAWPLLIVTLLLVLIYVSFSHWIQRKISRINQHAEKQSSAKLNFLSDALQNKDLIKTTTQQQWFTQHWQTHAQQTAVSEAQKRYVSGWVGVLASSLSAITSVTLLVVGTYLIHAKLLSVGGLIACNLLASRAMSIVSAFYTVFSKWQDFKRAAKKLDAEIAPLHSNHQKTSPKPNTQGAISIIDVSKTHPKRPPLLQQINLHIQGGERIGLLGKPGAGKSTLLKALSGLVPLDRGSILIDGVDIAHIHPSDRAHWMAWKGQELCLFSGTLAENLMALGSIQPAQLEQALWISTLEEELRMGKLSLNMLIEPQGLNLSGGQRQKIALARTLAQTARILLLDEPTQGFDSDTEHTVVNRLKSKLSPNCTMILTTHSSRVLSLTQRIIALDQGNIVADGPTEKLLVH